MIWFLAAVLVGLVILVWSADRFVDGAAATAVHLGLPPLLIGMVIIGFGTSAPELVVSALAASGGNPGLALGNAYGSNISNIALILGITALVTPLAVHGQVVRREVPILLGATAFAAWQLLDGDLSRGDGIGLLILFALIMGGSIWYSWRSRNAATDLDADLPDMTMKRALAMLALGLVFLIASSRLLVWGAVGLAQAFGVSDLVIGLTIVAIGTSLPELASSISAARKGAHDMVLGNIVGSNLFNTLAVVGIAATIHPLGVAREILVRDVGLMAALTLALLFMAIGIGRMGRIGRLKGGALLAVYAVYLGYLVVMSLSGEASTLAISTAARY